MYLTKFIRLGFKIFRTIPNKIGFEENRLRFREFLLKNLCIVEIFLHCGLMYVHSQYVQVKNFQQAPKIVL